MNIHLLRMQISEQLFGIATGFFPLSQHGLFVCGRIARSFREPTALCLFFFIIGDITRGDRLHRGAVEDSAAEAISAEDSVAASPEEAVRHRAGKPLKFQIITLKILSRKI